MIAGMMFQDLLAERLAVDMRIDLGSRDFLVAEHLLDGPQVGAAFQQVRGKRMAEGMWADPFMDTSQGDLLLDDVEDHDPRERGAPAVEKQDVLEAFLGYDLDPVLEIVVDLMERCLGNGYQTLLVALAQDPNEALFGVDIRVSQVDQFRYAQPAAVENLQHGPVAVPFRLGKIDRGDDPVDLVNGQDLGQAQADLGRLEQFGRVGLDVILQQEKSIKRLDAANYTGLRTGMYADVTQLGHELLQVLVCDLGHGLTLLVSEPEELVDIGEISVDGVWR